MKVRNGLDCRHVQTAALQLIFAALGPFPLFSTVMLDGKFSWKTLIKIKAMFLDDKLQISSFVYLSFIPILV